MELQEQIVAGQQSLATAENVLPLCELAKGYEEAGEFEQAAETLRPYWTRLGQPPLTDGLVPAARAEVLLRAGALTGWLGSSKQLAGSQELAKDLISESAALFSQLGLTEKAAEARVDLSICYWREGGLDEARITLQHVLDTLENQNSEQRLRALLNSAIVEKVATRDLEALRIYKDSAALFESSSNHALKGKFHNSYATLLKSLGQSENRSEYIDKALVEFTAASFHFEQAGHKRFQARVENNVGFLFAGLSRFPEAHEHLGRARAIFAGLSDQGAVANCDDTRAQTFLLEGKYADAERVAGSAVRIFKDGGHQSLLAEALTTQGKALARLNRYPEAKTTIDQAITVAEQGGDPSRGGMAALSAMEELTSYLSSDLLLEYYRTAESLLANSQNRGLEVRLGDCARRVLASSKVSEPAVEETINIGDSFSLDAEVLRYEGNLIKQALARTGGSVTRAARLLGVTHQGLAFIINGRHSDLLSARTPVKHRRKSIIRYH